MVHMTDAEAQARLRRAADDYRRALKKAEDLQKKASADLAAAIREAYVNGTKKADILRGIDHVWSRTWLDNALKSK